MSFADDQKEIAQAIARLRPKKIGDITIYVAVIAFAEDGVTAATDGHYDPVLLAELNAFAERLEAGNRGQTTEVSPHAAQDVYFGPAPTSARAKLPRRRGNRSADRLLTEANVRNRRGELTGFIGVARTRIRAVSEFGGHVPGAPRLIRELYRAISAQAHHGGRILSRYQAAGAGLSDLLQDTRGTLRDLFGSD